MKMHQKSNFKITVTLSIICKTIGLYTEYLKFIIERKNVLHRNMTQNDITLKILI